MLLMLVGMKIASSPAIRRKIGVDAEDTKLGHFVANLSQDN
jgi:hypothetical protein